MSYGGNGKRDPRTSVDEAPFPEEELSEVYAWAGGLVSSGRKRVWIIEDLLVQSRQYIVLGKWKSGKTTIVLDAALHAAMEMLWAGKRTTKVLPVWIAGESYDDVLDRFEAWCIRHKLNPEDVPFLLRKRPTDLSDQMKAQHVATAIRTAQKEKGLEELPVLLIIDTVAKNHSGDENSVSDMSTFLNNVRQLDATSLLIHHPGRGDETRIRGSSAIDGDIDGTLRVTKEVSKVGPEIVRLKASEMRNCGADEGELAFRIDVVELGWRDSLDRITDATVLQWLEDAPPAKDPAETLKGEPRAIYGVLRELYSEARDRLEAGGYEPGNALIERAHWRHECIERKAVKYPQNFNRSETKLCEDKLIRPEGIHVVLDV